MSEISGLIVLSLTRYIVFLTEFSRCRSKPQWVGIPHINGIIPLILIRDAIGVLKALATKKMLISSFWVKTYPIFLFVLSFWISYIAYSYFRGQAEISQRKSRHAWTRTWTWTNNRGFVSLQPWWVWQIFYRCRVS